MFHFLTYHMLSAKEMEKTYIILFAIAFIAIVIVQKIFHNEDWSLYAVVNYLLSNLYKFVS